MKKIGLHPLFLLLGIVLVLCGQAVVFFTYLLVAVLHELAHAFTAKKLGYSLNKLFLMPYGVGLSFDQNFLDEKDEMIVALSGPVFNFCLAIVAIALWWVFPSTYFATELFVFANIITGAINFLPCYPLDGGRILTAFLSKKTQSRKKALKICFIFNYIISALLIVLFFLDMVNNFSCLVFAIFVFLGTFDLKLSTNYSLKNFPVFENNLTNLSNIKINQFAINDETKLFEIAKKIKKNNLNLIFLIKNDNISIIFEKQILNLFQKYHATTKIKDVKFD